MRLLLVGRSPDFAEGLLAGDESSEFAGQQLEEGPIGRGERHVVAGPRDALAREVDGQVAHLYDGDLRDGVGGPCGWRRAAAPLQDSRPLSRTQRLVCPSMWEELTLRGGWNPSSHGGRHATRAR